MGYGDSMRSVENKIVAAELKGSQLRFMVSLYASWRRRASAGLTMLLRLGVIE